MTIRDIFDRAWRRSVTMDRRALEMGCPQLSMTDLSWEQREFEIDTRLRSAFLGGRPDVETLEAVMVHLAAAIYAAESAEVVRVETGTAA